MGRSRNTGQDSQPHPSIVGGREELRASILKPYLLQFRDERGEATARALLATVGLASLILDNETAWISVRAARRALSALATALGRDAIAHCSSWMTHPETLGGYVQMLRVSSEPLDVYRYLTAHANESTRVGTFEIRELTHGKIEVTYHPIPGVADDQKDSLLCLARSAELEGVPLFWGLPPAVIDHTECLSEGAAACRYVIRWEERSKHQLWLGVSGGIVATGAPVALSGNFLAAGIGAVIGGAFGGTISYLSERITHERRARAFEKNRIAALERGLELRGLGMLPEGDLGGTVLGGKYRILHRIGSGGIGAVYAAEHVSLGHRVAVKLLRGAAAADASETARLRREAQVQVSIEHPNIIRTLDLDQTPDGSIYVVMELLHGISLAERLREGPVPCAQGVYIFLRMCRALDAAHRMGVIHRDLKPGNVFLCYDGSVKVLDFGMSKFAQAESLTQEGYTLGTPEYMSPEQCIGAPLDPRSDLYAFGILMYETLTGDIPIQSRNRRDLLELHQRAVPVPMRERRPDLGIPEELDRIVLACLAKRAGQRPTNAVELETRLSQIPAERPIVAVSGRTGSTGRFNAPQLPHDSSSFPPRPSVGKQNTG
jgi:eukaryotic-like serine/threonine-protein kinase